MTEEGYAYKQDGTKELPGGKTISYALNLLNTKAFADAKMSEKYGVPFNSDYWDKMEYAPFAPIPPMPDDLEQIAGRVGDVIKTYSWQMVMAENDAEYEKAYEFGQKYS